MKKSGVESSWEKANPARSRWSIGMNDVMHLICGGHAYRDSPPQRSVSKRPVDHFLHEPATFYLHAPSLPNVLRYNLHIRVGTLPVRSPMPDDRWTFLGPLFAAPSGTMNFTMNHNDD